MCYLLCRGNNTCVFRLILLEDFKLSKDIKLSDKINTVNIGSIRGDNMIRLANSSSGWLYNSSSRKSEFIYILVCLREVVVGKNA
jgi:hypothetical protein